MHFKPTGIHQTMFFMMIIVQEVKTDTQIYCTRVTYIMLLLRFIFYINIIKLAQFLDTMTEKHNQLTQ